MGTISKGILGGFSGKVGNVVGGNWKGIDYMRSRAPQRTGEPSPAQQDQQIKFLLMIRFLQTVLGYLQFGFKNYQVRKTSFNSAMSYNMKNAITGISPDYAVNYSQVLLSRGDLPNAQSITAAQGTTGKIVFTWQNNAGVGQARATDKAMLMIYSPVSKACIYSTGSALRSAGTETFDVTDFTNQTVQTYVAFISADGKELSNSQFTGAVVVPD